MAEVPVMAIPRSGACAHEEQTTTYEILVRGNIGERLAGQLGARRFGASSGRTLLVVEVIDQAHLHGVLRRVGDLNVEIERISQLTLASSRQEE
jgi:hypothetical protein